MSITSPSAPFVMPAPETQIAQEEQVRKLWQADIDTIQAIRKSAQFDAFGANEYTLVSYLLHQYEEKSRQHIAEADERIARYRQLMEVANG